MLAKIVAVGLLAVVVQGCLSPEDLINSLYLPDKDIKECFEALDIERDGLITLKDMEKLYWHNEAEFARKKFLELVDNPLDARVEVDVKELGAFMNRRSVKLAVYECKYVKSRSLRSHCYADQVLTFVYLVLDVPAIGSFFKSIESPNDHDDLICHEEVAALKQIWPEFSDEDVENFLLEIGHDDKRITMDEFTEYVLQEDLHDDFRTCRVSLSGTDATYNNTCLTIELMDFTKNHLTELDIATTFDEFDQNDNRVIKADEVMATMGCESDMAERFITLMDKSRDRSVSYGEFRTYVKSHTNKLHLERECSIPKKKQEAEIKCYKETIMQLVQENHKPIWLVIPDLDMLFTFETIDKSNNGKISKVEDLQDGLKWTQELAQKFIEEMDSPDDDRDVNLEEFNEYVDEPHIVYGIADCMNYEKGTGRIDCYIDELKDIINDMQTTQEVEELFKFYDKDGNGQLTTKELESAGVTGGELQYFFNELGMGDDIITKREFNWYIKQQELSDLLKNCKSVNEKHTELMKYLRDYMTEYDIQELFSAFDEDHDEEIDESDFLSDREKIKHLIQKMDKDKSNSANFVEFWLFLNSPIGNPKKKNLEDKCTKPMKTQQEEMTCYKTEIFNL